MNNFDSASRLVIDWIKEYQAGVEKYPVLSKLKPGDLLNALPQSPPEDAQEFAKIFSDFKEQIIPGVTHWQHPQFFGYFPANTSPPSLLAEMLISALGVQGMSWITSPAATELEIRMMQWLGEAFGFGPEFKGVIQDSASSSTIIAMLVARDRAAQDQIGVLTAYCSQEAHSSIEKAAGIIGIGRKNLRKIPVNEKQEIKLDILKSTLEEDLKNGFIPFFLVGAFGTTSTTAVDNLKGLAEIAKSHSLWFHVDAAYAGSALILPEVRDMAEGISLADSIVVNPHKWLMTHFDCSAFFCKHPDLITASLGMTPEYLKTLGAQDVTDYRDWSLGLGRRFRSLKLWFVLRWYGLSGLRQILSMHVALAQKLEHLILADSKFEMMAQRKFNLVCFRAKGSCAQNKALLESLNGGGRMFLTHTKVDGKFTIRWVTGQTDVREHHVLEAWEIVRETWDRLETSG